MRIFGIVGLTLLLVTVSCYYTNRQARKCVDEVATEERCFRQLSDCFGNKTCSEEYTIYEKCIIDDDDAIFNGYCFREWEETAIDTKPVIDCLVRECNLTYNSKYSIRRFYSCSRAVLEAYGQELDCDDTCLQEMGKIKTCLEVQPYDECYDLEKRNINNPKALKILQDVKIMCLEASTGKAPIVEPT